MYIHLYSFEPKRSARGPHLSSIVQDGLTSVGCTVLLIKVRY